MTVQLPDPATEDCRALSSILARVGDKWTVLIVVLLGDGPKRFNEIKRMVGGISQRMLTFTLRGLGSVEIWDSPKQDIVIQAWDGPICANRCPMGQDGTALPGEEVRPGSQR